MPLQKTNCKLLPIKNVQITPKLSLEEFLGEISFRLQFKGQFKFDFCVHNSRAIEPEWTEKLLRGMQLSSKLH